MPTYAKTGSTTGTTSDQVVASKSFATKILNASLVVTSQSVTKAMANQRNKSGTNSATTGQSVVVTRTRLYPKTGSSTATSAASATVLRARAKSAVSSAASSVSASAVRGKPQNITTTVISSDSVVRAPSVFNRSVTSLVQTDVGAIYQINFAGVYFSYYKIGKTLQVNLKNPRFGNMHSVALQTVATRSRSGLLYMFKRTPTYESFKLEFDRIDEIKFNELINFVKTTAGQLVYYNDHKNQKWVGHIMTDPFDLLNDMHALTKQQTNTDWYTLALQFEGNKA